MKRQRTPRDSQDGPPGRAGGPRVAETRLLGALAALAALGAVILTGLWVVSLVGDDPSPSPPQLPRRSPPIAGQQPGAGSLARDREPVAETSEVFASRDPFGPLRPGDRGSGEVARPGGTSRPPWAHVVELAQARRGQAQVTIDDGTYTVSAGQRFARYFRLLYTSADCAAILFGDDQFTICEGERILK